MVRIAHARQVTIGQRIPQGNADLLANNLAMPDGILFY
jgi:hypothetical protein